MSLLRPKCGTGALRLRWRDRQYPRFAAADGAGSSEQFLDQPLPEPLALMRRCNADFVDPEIRARLVRVQVDDRRHKANDAVLIDRDHEPVAPIVEERGGRARIHRVVEDVRSHVGENPFILRSEQSNLNGHQ